MATPARAWALRCLGNLDCTQRRHDDARARYQESLRIARQVGRRAPEARAIANLGVVAGIGGDWTRGRDHYEEALTIFRRLGNDWLAAHTLCNLAHATLRLDRRGRGSDTVRGGAGEVRSPRRRPP